MPYKLDKAKILIAEDMLPMQVLTKSLLRAFGFSEIYTADNGEAAFELFCRHNPDLVITDWVMAPVDGLALIQKMRKDPRSPNRFVPVIIMSGYGARPRVESARDQGVTEFLVKPFTAYDLYAKIEHVIERPRRFVEAEGFFGPDRRRKRSDGFDGQKKRDDDLETKTAEAEIRQKYAAETLKALIEKTRKTT